MKKTKKTMPAIPKDMLEKWQRVVDLMARTAGVPAGLIMRVDPPQIEVFVASRTKGNPYEKGERADLNTGLYCEIVMKKRSSLLVPNARKDPKWDHNPDIKLGMVYYYGFPIEWPDGEIFGTICVLDKKENPKASAYGDLFSEFKQVIERDLHIIAQNQKLKREVAKTRKAKKNYQQKEMFLSRIIDESPYAIWISDEKGTLVRLNQACCRLLNITEADVVDKYNVLKDNIVKEQGYMPLVESVFKQGKTVRFELRYDSSQLKHLKLKKTAFVVLDVTIFPILDENGKITNAVIQHIDITDRKIAEDAVKESEESYRTFAQNLPGIVYRVLLREKGNMIFFNEMLEKMTGYTPEELKKGEVCSIEPLIVEDDRRSVIAAVKKAMRTGGEFEVEYRLKRKDGEERNSIEHGRVRLDEKGKPEFIDGVIFDITDRKKAEAKLRESEEMLRLFIKHAPAAMAMFDREMHYLAVSRRWMKDYKLDGEIIGRSHYEIFPEISERLKEIHRRCLAGAVEKSEGDRFDRGDGSINWLKWEARPWFDSTGKIGGIVIFSEDITENKRTEDALLASEGRYRLLAENILDVIWTMDNNFRFTYISPSIKELRGLTPEEAMEENLEDTMSPESFAVVGKLFAEMLDLESQGKLGRDSRLFEIQQKRKDGSLVWVEIQAQIIVDSSGKRIGFLGVSRNIEERKKAQKMVENERQRMFDVLETMPVMVCLLTPDYHVAFANRSFREKFGESHGRHCYEYCFGLTEPCEYCESYNVLKTGKPHHWEVSCPDGTIIDVYDFPFTDIDSSPLILEVDIDITDRKKAEEAVRESERRLADIIGFLPDATLAIDKDGIVIAWNKAMEELIGIGAADMVGKGNYEYSLPFYGERRPILVDLALSPDASVEKQYEGLKKEKGAIVAESYLPKVGRYLWGIATPLYDVQGNITGAIESLRDITDRKLANQKLHETTEYLDNLISYANAPIIVWDPEFRITRFNHAFEHIAGRTEKEVMGKNLEILFPDQTKQQSMEYIRHTLSGERWESVEIPIQHTDGKVRTLLWNSANIYGPDEKTLVAIIAQGQDITGRKLAEDQLKAMLKEKEVLLREVHHRVKNNMQVINSLISLQSQHIHDQQAIDSFADIRNRVMSMAAVHEGLYQSGVFTEIKLADYVKSMGLQLFKIYDVDFEKVKLETSIEDIPLDVDMAIPCGLIVSECVSNSLKYAFPGEAKGEITIEFHRTTDNYVQLTIKDNGIGIPGDKDLDSPETFGFWLIKILAQQLQGSVVFERRQGTAVTVEFPVKFRIPKEA